MVVGTSEQPRLLRKKVIKNAQPMVVGTSKQRTLANNKGAARPKSAHQKVFFSLELQPLKPLGIWSKAMLAVLSKDS